MIEKYPAGDYHEGRMYNYSRSAGHDVYRAKVIWCKELPEKASFYYYGVGVKYY
jgi:hypothetical protein